MKGNSRLEEERGGRKTCRNMSTLKEEEIILPHLHFSSFPSVFLACHLLELNYILNTKKPSVGSLQTAQGSLCSYFSICNTVEGLRI